MVKEGRKKKKCGERGTEEVGETAKDKGNEGDCEGDCREKNSLGL